VKTSFKAEFLRIEENVDVEVAGGVVRVLGTTILNAMAAEHLLASSKHVEKLSAHRFRTERKRTPNFVRVLVEEPLLTDSLPALIGQLKALGMDGIEPDFVMEACGQAGDPLMGGGLAWHLDNVGLLPGHRAGSDVNATEAWDVRTDASAVLVAIIDSGIASSDQELAPSIHVLPGEALGDGIDNDGNGYIDDALGYDFYHDDSNPEDEAGHGSMCAALIGATGNNGLGSSGVAWRASMLNCKFLDRNGLGLLSDAIEAIDYAREAGARVLNLSWSYDGDAPLLTEALGRCDSDGILMVCASGNSGGASAVPAPASIQLPHLIVVAASTPSDTLAPFSVIDPVLVDLVAPGVDLPVALSRQVWNAGETVVYATGTSFSAALVTGGLALDLAEFPHDSASTVIRRMLETVDPIAGGRAALSSGGRLNLGRMLGTQSMAVPHDVFAQRLMLSDAAGTWTGRNDGAGTETIDLNLGFPSAPQRTVWFDWTSPFDGLLRISMRTGDATPATLNVFSNTNDLPASRVANSTTGQTLEISVVAGQKLLWMVDSNMPITKDLTVSWQLPPGNDTWQGAQLVSGLPLTISGNSLGTTVENFEISQPHYRWLPQGSLWWKWTPGVAGDVFVPSPSSHLVLILPLSHGAPSFPLSYDYGVFGGRYHTVAADKTYAILVIPLTPAAAGPFTVAITGIGDIAILNHPSDVSTLPGETVELEVQVATSSYPAYQWFKDGEPIPFANSPTLKHSPVTAQSFGSYHVTASSLTTTVTSDPAVVSPRFEVPRLVGQTPLRSVVLGQSVDLSATFRSATEVTYAWRKDGHGIADEVSPSFVINSCLLADAGTYTLTATNPAGSSVATFQVNVFETPWNGWVNRTPATIGRGAIMDVDLSGNIANAFTSTEWLQSADGGQSWTSTPLPSNFIASACTTDSNGTALVSGGVFTTFSAYYSTGIWRKSPGAGWQKLQPILTLPDGSETAVSDLTDLTFFDGEWWGLFYTNYAYQAVRSADGINWTPLSDPANPSVLMRASEMFRYEDRLAISYWISSSKQTVQLRSPGGGVKILNFLGNDVRRITRIGDASYSPHLTSTLRILDSQSAPTTIPITNLYPSTGFAEGIKDGALFYALQDGDSHSTAIGAGTLWFGVHEQTASSKSIGFSCFAKSGSQWLVGYPDGKLWAGSDLTKMPTWRSDSNGNSKLKAYENEFLLGKYHSSDGASWQPLGAAAGSSNPVSPLGQAEHRFMHSIRQGDSGSPIREFRMNSMYPSAEGPTTLVDFQSVYWSGEDSLLRSTNTNGGIVLDIIRNQPPGLLVEDIDLGVIVRQINFAKQINGRWFLSGTKDFPYQPFFYTSTNGRDWQNFVLPVGCVIGEMDGAVIAIENSARGYFSTTGASWTPFTPLGLPPVNSGNEPAVPSAIVSYRGNFILQYPLPYQAQVGGALYSSADGVSWALSSAPLPVDSLHENRNTLLAVTPSGVILQPGGEVDSGPSVFLPESQQAVTVPRNQGFKYEVTAADPDGDLVSVECYLDGAPIASSAATPFIFLVSPNIPGVHAIEFVARDSAGRTSRVTSTLTMLQGGVTEATALVIDMDLSKAVFFKGDYYRIHTTWQTSQAAACVWEGGDRWRPVTPAEFKPLALVANSEAIVASTLEGILVSRDGVNWIHFGGFKTTNQTAPVLGVRDGLIYASDLAANWVSQDGFSWSFSEEMGPPFYTTSTGTITWVDSEYGLSYQAGEGKVTYDGGLTWIKLPGNLVSSGVVVSIENGFLIRSGGGQSSDGIYRMLRGELSLTRIEHENSWPPKLYIAKVDGVTFTGKAGAFLRTTVDGISFTDHTPPPNENYVSMRRFGGEWIAASSDMICASGDLRAWRVLVDFRSFGYTSGDFSSYYLTSSMYGLDGILFEHPRLPTKGFLLEPDFSITQISTASPTTFVYPPDAQTGGLRFKGRIIALSTWYFTRSIGATTWEQAPLYPSEGFIPPYQHAWPTTGSDRYQSASFFAATAGRVLMLKPDIFNVPLNYVFTTDDGRSFTVHNWAGPIPLPEVTGLSASADGFLASATNGRVLRSADGLNWTVHEVSPSLSITSILHFNGKWCAAGKQGTQAEVWTSPDGVAWSRSYSEIGAGNFSSTTFRPAFVAHGIARMHAGSFSWLRSSDGVTWQRDDVWRLTGYEPQGEHPQGIFCRYPSNKSFVIIDPEAGTLVRKIDTGSVWVRWLSGWPFLYSPGRLVEWAESDPRLTEITCNSGVFGVGDYLKIRLSAAELADPTAGVRFLLTTDQKLGNEDDVVLASTAWSSGELLEDGGRRFSVPLPTSSNPGKFRVAARLELSEGASDNGLQNNQIVTDDLLVEIPGYELRLTTIGEGSVNADDPRILYPQGARLQLEAVPRNGFTFRSWSGSLISAEAAISVMMEEDKQLLVTFTPGHRVVTKVIGLGSIGGASGTRVLLPGESVQLSQNPASGWKFDGWLIDGVPQAGETVSLQPTGDALIEAVFVPDWSALRGRAFQGASAGTDRSWSGDPDGDGLTNWQELLLSSDPTISGSLERLVEKKSDQMRLVFSRPQGPSGIPWIRPEFSENLADWGIADALRLTERVLSARDGMETVEITLPIRAGASGFFRLRMAAPPTSP
jgi:hypothetical protein